MNGFAVSTKPVRETFDFSDEFFELIARETIQRMDWFDKPSDSLHAHAASELM
jgi:hypothetical protein